MAYKCILIDHDDTVAPTTEFIHYPSFNESMKVLRPNMDISFDLYMEYSFTIGFDEFIKKIVQLNEEEANFMYNQWKIHTSEKIAIFYEEIKKFLLDFRKNGGIIGVVTHSDRERIEKDYKYNLGFIPEDIYSWELGEFKRKPYPYPVFDIRQKYGLLNEEILVIDDLKPGYLMAKEAGVDFLWAAWAYRNKPKFNEYMETHGTYCFYSIEKFIEIISNKI